ncbi:MAG: hypothetical protein GY705_07290 [Bacteroidetes bacterium]|nr:hypothetical protein [Bacteroidota bacterium]
MKTSMLSGNPMPFCPGCGHGIAVKNLSKALEEAGYNPLDVILVSDIGCSGLVDPLFATHTIHGLHGRSPALGMGVSLGLNNPDKKVIVIQGDGGATIGLQHILEAARRNVDMTLLVLNNLLYGMTGGQISGLSTPEFKSFRQFDDDTPAFDVVQLAHASGAAYCSRVLSPASLKDTLNKAISVKGFSLVEIACLCPSYGVKKMKDIPEMSLQTSELINIKPARKTNSVEKPSLFSEKDKMTPIFESRIKKRTGIFLSGSAGGGVQSAARLFAQSGILAGLHTSMKGEYPITVGTGFSSAEVILSRGPIQYTGLESPDVIIAVSEEGLRKAKPRIQSDTRLILDNSLINNQLPNVIYGDFQRIVGKKGAIIMALAFWILDNQLMPLEAFSEAVSSHKHSDKLLPSIRAAEELFMEVS